MAGFTQQPGRQLWFLACGCPKEQGDECPWYANGCGSCEGCLSIPEDGLPTHFGKATCLMLTGLNRLRVGPYVLSYPRELTVKYAKALDGAVWRRDTLWTRLMLQSIIFRLTREAKECEVIIERINNAAMRIQDGRAQEVVRATGGAADLHAGVYVDVDLIHGTQNQTQRVKVEVVAPIIGKKLVDQHAELIRIHSAAKVARGLLLKQMGFHLVRIARGYLGRIRYRKEADWQLRNAAATIIQTAFRGHYARKFVFAALRAKFRHDNAIKIQAAWRSLVVRGPYMHRRDTRRLYIKIISAIRIQAAWRAFRGRKVDLMARKRWLQVPEHRPHRIVPYSLLATPVSVLSAFENNEETARYTRKWALEQQHLTPPLVLYPALRVDLLMSALRERLSFMNDAIGRAVTAGILGRASRIGGGKLSSGPSVGTAAMVRRFGPLMPSKASNDGKKTAESGRRTALSTSSTKRRPDTPGMAPESETVILPTRLAARLTRQQSVSGSVPSFGVPKGLTAASLAAVAMRSLGVPADISKNMYVLVRNEAEEAHKQAEQAKQRMQQLARERRSRMRELSTRGGSRGTLGTAKNTLPGSRTGSKPATAASAKKEELPPAEAAVHEVYRLAEEGLLSYFQPWNFEPDPIGAQNSLPLREHRVRHIDETLQFCVYASGLPIDAFLTKPEVIAITRRKENFLRSTEKLEQAAALIVAAGTTDAIIDMVASLSQHLVVTNQFRF